jgi:hypothetical protein
MLHRPFMLCFSFSAMHENERRIVIRRAKKTLVLLFPNAVFSSDFCFAVVAQIMGGPWHLRSPQPGCLVIVATVKKS